MDGADISKVSVRVTVTLMVMVRVRVRVRVKVRILSQEKYFNKEAWVMRGHQIFC